MPALFNRLTQEVAFHLTTRGKGTGGWSKMLSGALFPLLTALAVVLLKESRYIVLFILLLLTFTKIGWFVLLALLGYFICVKAWIATSLLGSYYFVQFFSFFLGKRNVKRLFLAGKPLIGPFEGATDLVIWVVLQCLFLAIALLTWGWLRGVMWVLFGLLTLQLWIRYSFRLYPRWRQIHEPLMCRYAAAAGEESVLSKTEGRAFDIARATRRVLRTVYPNTSEDEMDSLMESINAKLHKFSDHDLLQEQLIERNPTADPRQLDELFQKVKLGLEKGEAGALLVRYGIAEVVEDVFGREERGRYLWAVYNGKVT